MGRRVASLAWLAALAAACGSDLSLDGRPCPCADGWVCCKVDDVCIRPGGACEPDQVEPVAVQIEPVSPRLRLFERQQFVANQPVTWSVDEADGGSIDEQGLYRAPMRMGQVHVRATAKGGASATASVAVGPTELTRALGFPGGMGSADGIGQNARLGRVGSIVGDGEYLYVIDEPEAEWPLGLAGSGEPQIAEKPMGVRRIALADTAVSWLVEDLPLRGLALADSYLFAGLRESEPFNSAARQLVRIDPETGESSFVAGAVDQAAPQDGVGSEARFGGISGLAWGMGSLYVTDTEPNCAYSALRRVDIWTGEVTTLAAGASWPGETLATAPFGCLGAVAFHEGKIYAADLLMSDVVAEGRRHLIWSYDPATGIIEERWTGLRPMSSEGLLALCFDDVGDAIGISGTWSIACIGEVFSDDPGCGSYNPLRGSPGGIWCDGTWWKPEPGGSWGAGYGSGSFYATTAGAIVELDRSSAESFGYGGTENLFAGTPEYDGPHTAGPNMRLDRPSGVSSDASGNLVVFENGDRFIRLDASGEVSALPCGPSSSGGSRNLSALSPAGDLYFLDGSTLNKVDHETGECAFLANIEVTDPANAVQVDLVHDGVGKLYLSSFHAPNRRVIRIDAATGEYETLLGEHSGFLATDGEKRLFVADLTVADATGTNQPCAVVILGIDFADLEPQAVPSPMDGWCATALAYDPVGVLYVAEATRHRVRALAVETGEVVDLVGIRGFEAVLPGPLPAALNRPIDIALLPDGALAIADFDEHVVLLAR